MLLDIRKTLMKGKKLVRGVLANLKEKIECSGSKWSVFTGEWSAEETEKAW